MDWSQKRQNQGPLCLSHTDRNSDGLYIHRLRKRDSFRWRSCQQNMRVICLFVYVVEYPAHMFSERPAMTLRTVREGETWWDWPWIRDSQADENLFEPIPEMYYPKQSPYFWTKDDQGSSMESFSRPCWWWHPRYEASAVWGETLWSGCLFWVGWDGQLLQRNNIGEPPHKDVEVSNYS